MLMHLAALNLKVTWVTSARLRANTRLIGSQYQAHQCLNLQVMMDWLAKLCGLPDKFVSNGASSKPGGGCIQSTSSEAVLVAMLAARARAMEGQPAESALKLVAYGSDQVRLHITVAY